MRVPEEQGSPEQVLFLLIQLRCVLQFGIHITAVTNLLSSSLRRAPEDLFLMHFLIRESTKSCSLNPPPPNSTFPPPDFCCDAGMPGRVSRWVCAGTSPLPQCSCFRRQAESRGLSVPALLLVKDLKCFCMATVRACSGSNGLAGNAGSDPLVLCG